MIRKLDLHYFDKNKTAGRGHARRSHKKGFCGRIWVIRATSRSYHSVILKTTKPGVGSTRLHIGSVIEGGTLSHKQIVPRPDGRVKQDGWCGSPIRLLNKIIVLFTDRFFANVLFSGFFRLPGFESFDFGSYLNIYTTICLLLCKKERIRVACFLINRPFKSKQYLGSNACVRFPRPRRYWSDCNNFPSGCA